MTNVFHYCLIVPPMVFSFSVVGVITDIILTKSVPVSDTGKALHFSVSDCFLLDVLLGFGSLLSKDVHWHIMLCLGPF